MAMNDIRILASLKNKLKSCTAKIWKSSEIIIFAIKLSSPKELIRMMGFNEINRKACIGKMKLVNHIRHSTKMETFKCWPCCQKKSVDLQQCQPRFYFWIIDHRSTILLPHPRPARIVKLSHLVEDTNYQDSINMFVPFLNKIAYS